jgi:hypothetical protein
MPGYAGHIPALDAGTSQTFGASTSVGLQDLAATIHAFDGATAHPFTHPLRLMQNPIETA